MSLRTVSWVLLALVGVGVFLIALTSANLAYRGDYPVGGVPIGEIASGREAVLEGLRGVRGTAAAWAAAWAALFLAVVLGPVPPGRRRHVVGPAGFGPRPRRGGGGPRDVPQVTGGHGRGARHPGRGARRPASRREAPHGSALSERRRRPLAALAAAVAFGTAAPGPGAEPLAVRPGTIVRWPGEGIEWCELGARRFEPLDGACYFPVDLLRRAGPLDLARGRGGKRETAAVRVGPFDYPIQKLTLPRHMVELSPEDLDRVEPREPRDGAPVGPGGPAPVLSPARAAPRPSPRGRSLRPPPHHQRQPPQPPRGRRLLRRRGHPRPRRRRRDGGDGGRPVLRRATRSSSTTGTGSSRCTCT